MDRLSAEVITKLDQNVSGGSGVVAGSIISVPSGQSAPAWVFALSAGEPEGIGLGGESSVSVARYILMERNVLDGKIYFAGGYDGSAKNIAERYDPAINHGKLLLLFRYLDTE